VGVEGAGQIGNAQMKVLHTVPVMTDMERDAANKRIGNDLYEIFSRIQAELQLSNEFIQKQRLPEVVKS